MATLLIYTNVNLPFVHFIVCWAFKTMAHRQNQALPKEPCAGDSFGIDLRDRESERGDRYRNRKIETKECISLCICLYVCQCLTNSVPLCFDILIAGQTVAGSFVLQAVFITTECLYWSQTSHSVQLASKTAINVHQWDPQHFKQLYLCPRLTTMICLTLTLSFFAFL